MIAIVNMGPQTDDPGGERTYEVRINGRVICTFRHYRREGLAECLRRAAEAVETKDINDFCAAHMAAQYAKGNK